MTATITALPDHDAVRDAAQAMVAAIPPAWPLAASVAVNPFLGQSHEGLAVTAARLARVGGVAITMPHDWYAARLASGAVTEADIAAAAAAACHWLAGQATAAKLVAAVAGGAAPVALPTVAELAAEASGIDWPGIIAERFGAWAAGYFDEGQALWAAPRGKSAYVAWRAVATHDLSPEIAGLRGFAAFAADAPETAAAAIERSTARLGLSVASLTTAYHRLATTLGGWAHYARYLNWQATLAGGDDTTLIDFLAIRLLWEEALFLQHGDDVAARWAQAVEAHAAPLVPTEAQIAAAVLQDACERAGQRRLGATLADETPPAAEVPLQLQAAFCIDVRSEVFRRSLESVDPAVQTIGFAGFFGLTAAHHRFASDLGERRLPVLLNPGLASQAGGPTDAAGDRSTRLQARAARGWGRFKLAAVSSFAFVEAAGPLYVAKLVRDALGLLPATAADPAPRLVPLPDLPARIALAAGVLRAMSLTGPFAPLVLIVGHGAAVVNNPHASALHCGACGGYSGEVNARLLAGLLNDAEVRTGLAAEAIDIPASTRFVAALHDTTTDAVTLYADDAPLPVAADHLAQARRWLAVAGTRARGERALRLPRARRGEDVAARSRNWAETRPEWALAGCSAFIAAPRSRTAGKPLGGRVFLHDYDWAADAGFGVLELILTAPVVVASWISLQYYGSTVAPALFGGGNKLLHNVVGGIGVVEGNGGTLRAGLPWQSVHDGDTLAHEPLRLTVAVEAPREAITVVLARHPEIRALFDNGWLHLFALDAAGRMAWRYRSGLAWEPVESAIMQDVGRLVA